MLKFNDWRYFKAQEFKLLFLWVLIVLNVHEVNWILNLDVPVLCIFWNPRVLILWVSNFWRSKRSSIDVEYLMHILKSKCTQWQQYASNASNMTTIPTQPSNDTLHHDCQQHPTPQNNYQTQKNIHIELNYVPFFQISVSCQKISQHFSCLPPLKQYL